MAQAGYTPIQLYYSTTASAAPSSGNLANGELAINITDGKLFYKDNGGVVQVLATKGAGTIGGSNTQVQYNNAGALAGSANLTFDGTTLTAAGLAGPHNGTVGATTPNTGAFTTLIASSTVTLSGGTANGVAYLNGSKVLTTGSALTYNGSTFSIAGTAATTSQVLNSTGSTTGATYGRWFNTGSDLVWGIESSAGGVLATGSSAYAALLYTNSAVPLQLGTAGTIKATIDSAGNFGLAVIPSANNIAKAFELQSGFNVFGYANLGYINANAYYNGGWIYKNTAAAGRYEVGDAHKWFTAPSGTAGNAISFTQAMTLNASGYLGINTTGPAYGLVVSNRGAEGLEIGPGSQYSAGKVLLQAYNRSGAAYVQLDSIASTFTWQIAGNENARIDSSGAFIVGGTSALNTNARLSVWNSAGSAFGIATGYGTASGQFRLIYLTSANNALNFDNGSNNATLTSGGVWTNASDARIKTNIQDIKYGLETVLSAKPRSYNRIDVDGDHIGFVAQELLKVIPEVVFGGDETKYSVDYGSLVAVAFKAIQEQQAIITQLKARLDAANL